MRTLFVILLLINAIFGIPSCSRELRKYADDHANCMSNAVQVQKLINKVISNVIDYTQLTDDVRTKCATADTTNCLENILEPVHRRCNDIPALQQIRNSYKLVLMFNEYVCQNNGSIYLDFLRDGGGLCYKNENKIRCYDDAKRAGHVAPFGITSLLDNNVCGILQADWSCLHHYDDCENPNVVKVYTQILNAMKQKFNCS